MEHRVTERVTVVKRVDFVIDAVAAAEVADCKLQWIGKDVDLGYAADLKTQADKLGVDVTLHVAISHSAM
jgi:hypothetical protein